MKQDVFHKMFQYVFSPNYTSSIKKNKTSPLHYIPKIIKCLSQPTSKSLNVKDG